MEPITIATAFGSIVSLLGVWKDRVEERESRNYHAYIDWLRRQEHNQLVELILGNDELSRSLRVLVEDQHGQVMKQLADLSNALASIASQMPEFKPLANAIRIQSGLSDQAVSILRQLNEANQSEFLELRVSKDKWDYTFLTAEGSLEIDDPRFIRSDLDTLCELKLLGLRHNKQGSRIFTITRAGAAVGG